MQNTPETLSGWFQFSKGDKSVGNRSEFFEALPSLSDHRFANLIKAAVEPVDGDLRSLNVICEEGRKEIPSEAALLEALRNRQGERELQYLLWHRRKLLDNQTIIAREVPCSLENVYRPAVADFLAIDSHSYAPIIVEVKSGTAMDSLTGVLLELLVQWCFHKSVWHAFLSQLREAGHAIPSHVTQPQAAIVAPSTFYQEVLRRSEDPRRWNEVQYAKRFLAGLQSNFELAVSFVEVSSDWSWRGTNLRCTNHTFIFK